MSFKSAVSSAIGSLASGLTYLVLILTAALAVAFVAVMVLGVAAGDNGCVESDEFDNKFIKIEANPQHDGVYGLYDDLQGGQIAEWHSTGLRTNNEDIIILISGAFTPWNASNMNDNKLQNLPRCKTCAQRNLNNNENCICYKGQESEPETTIGGIKSTADCDIRANQNDPKNCTCTTLNGKATDYGVFHFPLNYYNKAHERRLPDEQDESCKYEAGMNLYLGVFGRSNSEIPLRAYHLFSEDVVCPILRNSNGECIDEFGKNRLKYLFHSANKKTLVKDDLSDNDGIDENLDDDIYHKPNEYLKLIIYDRFYEDNYGTYNVEFLKGVAQDDETGLLEYLVRIIEDELLGKANSSGVREGGILKFMYQAITQDTYFMASLQVLLSLYITFFGISYLVGLVQINKKELYSRILKISIVIFFTSADSWEFYRQFFVGFFKDSMDFVITWITTLAESSMNQESNPLMIAASGSDSNQGSAATRFSYIDTMIKTLLSENVTKKIWGLFIEDIFGLIYILIIYALIAYFIYVMLVAASVYAITLMKLIFALSLGPIFITFSLFAHTNEMFKKWIAFIAGRSLEILILFLILYMLILLVDKQFYKLLYYRVCVEHIDILIFPIKVLRSYANRDFVDWIRMLGTLGGFIYLLQMIMDQVPALAGSLISIGGTKGGSGSESSFKLAGGMVKSGAGLIASGISKGAPFVAGNTFRAARFVSRATGLSGAIDKATDNIPFRSPRSILRDNTIDEAIRLGKAHAKSKGLEKGAKFDAAVRNFVFNDPKSGLNAWHHKNKSKAALYDMSHENIAKRLDKKLVKDPLKKFLKSKAKELKNKSGNAIPLGKEMNKELKEAARAWAEKNLSGGQDAINDHLHNLKNFMKKEGKLSDKKAAAKFAHKENLRDKYLRYLKDEQIERGKKHELKSKKAEKFLAKSRRKQEGLVRNLINRFNGKTATDAQRAMYDGVRTGLVGKGFISEREKVQKYYKDRTSEMTDSAYKRSLTEEGGKLSKKLNKIQEKREAYKRTLEKSIEDEIRNAPNRFDRYDAIEKLNNMRMLHDKEIGMISGNENWREYRDRAGGWYNLEKGLVDFNGDTLFEAETRANLTKDDIASSKSASGEETTLNLQAMANNSLIGGPADDTKSANIFNDSTKKETKVDNVLLSRFEADKLNARKDLGTKKWEMADKEKVVKELSAKKDLSETEKSRMNTLSQEISELNSDINKLERKITIYEAQIEDVKKGDY